MNIGIIGAGYVGQTTVICLASGQHKISIFDTSDKKIRQINDKKLPFFENREISNGRIFGHITRNDKTKFLASQNILLFAQTKFLPL